MDTKVKKRTMECEPDLLCEWDLVPTRSTIKLFHANAALKIAQRELIVSQIDAEKEKRYNLRDWQELQANKRELRRQFKTTNRTICDNKASTKRFKQKIKELLQDQILVQDQINNTELEIEKYSETKEKMEKYVKLYSKLFTSYLEKVAQKCPEFNSVQDILNRYEILENCKNNCSQLLEKEMDEALELKRKMMKLVEEKSSRLKTLHNTLVMLGVRRKKTAEVLKYWNHMVIQLEEVIATKFEESVTLQEGCYDLYQEIYRKRKIKPTMTKEDTKNQMYNIENKIVFYKDVIHLAMALQQYQKQEKQPENSICKTSFVRSILNDLMKRSVENTKRH